MTKPHRQRYGLGSIIKKITKPIKKVLKSPIGKAALIGGGLWGLNRFGIPGTGGMGQNWWSKGLGRLGIGSSKLASGLTTAQHAAMRGVKSGAGTGSGIWNWIKKNPGQAGLLSLGAAGTILPFMGTDEDEEEVIDDWSVTPSSIANIRQMARNQDPSLAFLPPAESVMSGYYGSKDGGIVGLANGGQPAQAQAEQMLKMEYQKYRNQGGTMSYQQFKMAVLQQAQGQGPMAQGQGPQGFANGELVTDASMVEATPAGLMEENVEEVQGEPTREQLEALAMEIFQLRLEELDEEQLMVVYQTAMKQQPKEEMMQEEIEFNPQMSGPVMAAHGGRIGYRERGFVDPEEVDDLNIFEFMKDQGVNYDEMAEGVNQEFPSDDLGAINVNKEQMAIISDLNDKGMDISLISTISGAGEDVVTRFIRLLNARAQGGRVRRAEGGIMDLGGMEKDYRNEGGFVALGGKERADDVPARLSKNEFVFTADAVRNAGGGDIDAGADVMQNMMENLESGGQISEESQGAQGRYNNMQQLQTRIA